MGCSTTWIERVDESEIIQATKITYMSIDNQVRVAVLTPWGELTQMVLDIGITDVFPWSNPDNPEEYIKVSCLEIWETSTGTPIKIQVCYEAPPREYDISKIGYFTGISQYSATSCRPSGMAFIVNLAYCPNWKRDCSYSCFGSFNNEGYTRQQTIDKAFRNVVGRSGSVLLKESFYNADKQYIDNWRARNPNILIFVGYPVNTYEKCYDMVANELLLVDSCEGVICDKICVGIDLYSQKCVDGECVPDQLIEKNSSNCGYIPPDPCEGIICPDYCDDINHIKYTNGYCVNGKCVYDTIEENSVECGYIIPEIEEPIDKEPFGITKIYGILVGIGLGAILLFKK